jgi:hypothetical protein
VRARVPEGSSTRAERTNDFGWDGTTWRMKLTGPLLACLSVSRAGRGAQAAESGLVPWSGPFRFSIYLGDFVVVSVWDFRLQARENKCLKWVNTRDLLLLLPAPVYSTCHGVQHRHVCGTSAAWKEWLVVAVYVFIQSSPGTTLSALDVIKP